MNITNITPISFTKLNMHKLGALKVPEDFTCKTRDNNEYTVTCMNTNHFRPDEPTKDSYEFDLIKQTGEFSYDKLAYAVFKKQDNHIFNSMITNIGSKTRNNGNGTILHLSRVAVLLENNLDYLKLKALPEAVFFHSRFGFRSNLTTRTEANFVVSSIIPTCFASAKLEDVSVEASKILSERINLSNEEYLERTNRLFDKFLDIYDTLNKDERERIYMKNDFMNQELMYGMILTRARILEHKDFYNDLFKKYAIDYQIP